MHITRKQQTDRLLISERRGDMGHGDWKGVRAIATLHQRPRLACPCPHTICRPQTRKSFFNIEQHIDAALTSRLVDIAKAKRDSA